MPTLPILTGPPALLGGEPACTAPWPSWPIADAFEEGPLLETLRSGQWWYGERVQQFEAAYAKFQGAQYAVSCTNGTTALEMALRGLGVGPEDEVIVPPYSFIATASAAVSVGAIPVFADIEPDTLCLDPEDVQRKITSQTKAIVPVHVGGRIADMARLNAIAKEAKLQVLEDAAHAWGSQWKGRGAGTLGRCGTFSFQVTKNLTAGEGGMLVTDDEQLADLCRSYSHCGRAKGSAWYDHDLLGSNLRMTEFQAALLHSQLGRLEGQIERRARNADLLDAALAGVHGIELLSPAPAMTRRSYHMFIFRIREAELGVSRARFLEALKAEGAPASEGWYRPLYRNGVFQSARDAPFHPIAAPLAGRGLDYSQVSCPVCAQVCEDAVWIPQTALLAEDESILRLAAAIRRIAAFGAALR